MVASDRKGRRGSGTTADRLLRDRSERDGFGDCSFISSLSLVTYAVHASILSEGHGYALARMRPGPVHSSLRNTVLNRLAASMSSPVGTRNSPLVTASLLSSVRTHETMTELA